MIASAIPAFVPAIYLAIGFAFLILVALSWRMPRGLGALVIVFLWPALLAFMAIERVARRS